jgi:hypothetical protein
MEKSCGYSRITRNDESAGRKSTFHAGFFHIILNWMMITSVTTTKFLYKLYSSRLHCTSTSIAATDFDGNLQQP